MTGWTCAAVSVVCLVLTLCAAAVCGRRLREITGRHRAMLDTQAMLEQLLNDLQGLHDVPSCTRCGQRFAQVGPKDWEHSYCPAARS